MPIYLTANAMHSKEHQLFCLPPQHKGTFIVAWWLVPALCGQLLTVFGAEDGTGWPDGGPLGERWARGWAAATGNGQRMGMLGAGLGTVLDGQWRWQVATRIGPASDR